MTIPEYNLCVDQYSDGVYRFILKNIKESDTAQDIVQESFIKMWERVKDISFAKAKSYLFTTAYHTMIDHIRKNKHIQYLDDSYDNIQNEPEANHDLKSIIDHAVAKLPDIQRSVVLLRDYEGYSYQEIGEITGLGESQVKVYIFRARNFLKQYLGSIDVVM